MANEMIVYMYGMVFEIIIDIHTWYSIVAVILKQIKATAETKDEFFNQLLVDVQIFTFI